MSFYNKPFPQMTQFTCASTLALSTIVLESAISPLIAQPKNEDRSRYVCYIENEVKKEKNHLTKTLLKIFHPILQQNKLLAVSHKFAVCS